MKKIRPNARRLFHLDPDPEHQFLPARRLLEAAGFDGRAIDVERLARMVGIRRISDVPLLSVNACLVPDRYGYTVLVDRLLPHPDRRFAIAHEIGHVLLNASSNKYRTAAPSATREELLCDQIASELLLPRIRFERELGECEPSLSWIEALADRYEVPPEIAAARAAELSSDGIEATCWERQQNHFIPRWILGSSILRQYPGVMPSSVAMSDFGNCVVRAFTSGRLAVAKRTVADRRVTIHIESKRFGTLSPYVLSLARYPDGHPATLSGGRPSSALET